MKNSQQTSARLPKDDAVPPHTQMYGNFEWMPGRLENVETQHLRFTPGPNKTAGVTGCGKTLCDEFCNKGTASQAAEKLREPSVLKGQRQTQAVLKGHDFSRANRASKIDRLQPLRDAFVTVHPHPVR